MDNGDTVRQRCGARNRNNPNNDNRNNGFRVVMSTFFVGLSRQNCRTAVQIPIFR